MDPCPLCAGNLLVGAYVRRKYRLIARPGNNESLAVASLCPAEFVIFPDMHVHPVLFAHGTDCRGKHLLISALWLFFEIIC